MTDRFVLQVQDSFIEGDVTLHRIKVTNSAVIVTFALPARLPAEGGDVTLVGDALHVVVVKV